MERFIATVEDEDLRRQLNISIDGKGAFRRFKDALVNHPVDRERWFAFRSERLRSCMDSWLTAHGIHSVERPTWHVPTAQEIGEVQPETTKPAEPDERVSRVAVSDAHRKRLHALVDGLSPRDMETAGTFLEFLQGRHHAPSLPTKVASEPAVAEAPSPAESE
jgi:hypothetical protein